MCLSPIDVSLSLSSSSLSLPPSLPLMIPKINQWNKNLNHCSPLVPSCQHLTLSWLPCGLSSPVSSGCQPAVGSLLKIEHWCLIWIHGGKPTVCYWEAVSSWRWSPHAREDCLIKGPWRLPRPFCHVNTQWREGCLWTRKRDLTRHWVCQHLHLGLSLQSCEREMFVVYKPPSPWYSVIAAQTN